MTREEAIQVLQTALTAPFIYGEYAEAIDMAIEALSADAEKPNMKSWNGLYIKVYADDDPQDKAEKLYQICDSNEALSEVAKCIQGYCDIPSAEAVQGWRTGKPTKDGKYMVTLDAWGHRYIALMHYDEPQMPNIEIDGACWYMSDNEWGDVVYDDKDILAWMPLPMPYREDGEA